MHDTLIVLDKVTGKQTAAYTVIQPPGSGDLFTIDGHGRLLRKPHGHPFVFRSDNACGAFQLRRDEHGWVDIRTVRFHNGVVRSFGTQWTAFGYRFEPTWAVISESEKDAEEAIAQLLQIIAAAAAGQRVDLTDPKCRAMVALALCRPSLLEDLSPASAWSQLEDRHFAALRSWAK